MLEKFTRRLFGLFILVSLALGACSPGSSSQPTTPAIEST